MHKRAQSSEFFSFIDDIQIEGGDNNDEDRSKNRKDDAYRHKQKGLHQDLPHIGISENLSVVLQANETSFHREVEVGKGETKHDDDGYHHEDRRDDEKWG